MDRRDFDDKIVDFLYDDLDPADRAAFQAEIGARAELEGEVREFGRVGQIYRKRLPDLQTPPALLQKVLAQAPKPKRRFAWFGLDVASFWRPALTGAFVMALTLAGIYQYKLHRDAPPQVAKNEPAPSAPAPDVPIPEGGGEISLRDLSLARAQTRPMAEPSWRQPRFGNGLISFASYGNGGPAFPSPAYPQAVAPGGTYEELYGLEQEAQNAVAQFAHQQALRMHSMGDHRGAAEALALLIKRYPNYSRLFEALALRIGCLYQIGQIDKAEQELAWLRQSSPELAALVEQRWWR
ncbi:MAG: hypothetical protein IT572_07570 [Deltaproteobacteria bacterium]|nr:hypothetical protein [Deltaproteobacteria bacterium]